MTDDPRTPGERRLPRSRRCPDRARARRPARPRASPTGRRSPSSRAKSPPPTAATSRTCCSCRAARASRRAADRPPSGWMKRAARRLPRPAARPARDGSVDAGRLRDPGRITRGAGRVPHPFPCRLDRPRRGADPGRARRRALEPAWPELRRLHLDHLPVDRSRRSARGVAHRRPGADRPPGRRHLRRDLPAADRAANRRYFARYPDDRARVAEILRSARRARTSGCRPATG